MAINVRVYLPPYIRQDNVDEKGIIQLAEGSTLRDLFKMLRVPFPAGFVNLARVNYEKALLDQKLHDGDTVSFFSLISGG